MKRFAACLVFARGLRVAVVRALVGAVVCVVVLAAPGAHAATPLSPQERDYIAVRDAAIKRINARIDATNKVDEVTSADDRRTLADLAARLRVIVGQVAIPGFAGEAKSNLDTLMPELGFGRLDGLVVASPEGRSSVVVTTEALLAHWLRAHRNWWGKKDVLAQDIASAARSEAFYTQATSNGAAMVSYGTLPVQRPQGASHASAILAARTQDQSPAAPDQMFVVLVKAGRVFLANAPLTSTIVPDPSCAALQETYTQRARVAFEAYRASGLRDKKLFERHSALEKEGDVAQRRCVSETLSAGQRAQAMKQADGMIELLAGR